LKFEVSGAGCKLQVAHRTTTGKVHARGLEPKGWMAIFIYFLVRPDTTRLDWPGR